MARLDSYDIYPEGMDKYLSFYGWHFSKKMCEWAVGNMYKGSKSNKEYIKEYPKEKVDSLLSTYGVKVPDTAGYDAVYVTNMCRADFLGSSLKGDAELARFVGDMLNDPDGYEGMVFTRFYADCIGKGVPIIWEDMI